MSDNDTRPFTLDGLIQAIQFMEQHLNDEVPFHIPASQVIMDPVMVEAIGGIEATEALLDRILAGTMTEDDVLLWNAGVDAMWAAHGEARDA